MKLLLQHLPKRSRACPLILLEFYNAILDRIEKQNYKPPKRIRTKPTRSSIERRLSTKKHQSEKKKNRKKPDLI